MKAIEIKINVDQTELDEALEKYKELERIKRLYDHSVSQKLRNQLERKNKALSKALDVLNAFDYCPLTYFEMVEDNSKYEDVKRVIDCENCCEDNYQTCWRRWLLDEE